MTTSNEWSADPRQAPVTTPDPVGTPIGDDVLGSGSGDSGRSATGDHGGSAKETAHEAADKTQEVMSAAKEEAQDVLQEARTKASDLLSDARAHADEQSRTQLRSVATKLGELGDELDSMVEGSDTQGPVADIARQLSERTRELSSHLAARDPGDLMEDVRHFARKRPGTFLAGALLAGVVAGRLTRGAKQANDDSSAQPPSGEAGAGASAATGTPEGTHGDPVAPMPGGLA